MHCIMLWVGLGGFRFCVGSTYTGPMSLVIDLQTQDPEEFSETLITNYASGKSSAFNVTGLHAM